MRKCATCCYRANKVRKCFPIVGNRRCNSQLMINSNLDICIIESDIRRLEPNSNKTNRILISFLVTILFLKLTKYPVCAVDKHVSSLPNSVSWYFGSHERYFNANVFKSMFLGEEQIETLIYINEREGYCAQRCVRYNFYHVRHVWCIWLFLLLALYHLWLAMSCFKRYTLKKTLDN